MIIKSLSESDIDKIIELYGQDFSDGWNKAQFLSSFQGGRFLCLGAFDGEKLVGAISLTLGLDDADIESVFTSVDYRRNGVADTLVGAALDKVKQLNLNKVLLEVRKTNESAKSLYFKHGFKEISVRKKYYPDGEDALILVWES
jgi:ribosomal-protein-alanine N-acetyltransferase